jgi:hypothetical protein
MANFIKIKDVVLGGYRDINVDQIVCITEGLNTYELRMANADCYRIDIKDKKLIQGVLNADIQLSSKRTTERTDRNIQRPAK